MNSQKALYYLFDVFSIKEMMALFKGCHNEMHIMKQKPIKKASSFGLAHALSLAVSIALCQVEGLKRNESLTLL